MLELTFLTVVNTFNYEKKIYQFFFPVGSACIDRVTWPPGLCLKRRIKIRYNLFFCFRVFCKCFIQTLRFSHRNYTFYCNSEIPPQLLFDKNLEKNTSKEPSWMNYTCSLMIGAQAWASRAQAWASRARHDAEHRQLNSAVHLCAAFFFPFLAMKVSLTGNDMSTSWQTTGSRAFITGLIRISFYCAAASPVEKQFAWLVSLSN